VRLVVELISGYRLRKCSDIEMEYPYFEVLDREGIAFMDISRPDGGELRVLFYPEISSKWMSLPSLESIIVEARTLFAHE
jgi:hypothetical protein